MLTVFKSKNNLVKNYYILILLGVILLSISPYLSLTWQVFFSISLVGLGSYFYELKGGVIAALWSIFIFKFWHSLATINCFALLNQGLIFGALFKYHKRLKEDLEQKNKKLKASEAKFKSYIDNAPYAVFVLNKKGEYLEVNSTACQMSGLAESDIVGKK
jgi:PAS domain-containing protein